MTDATQHLPVQDIRTEFEAVLATGPVVLTAPTGSGKSTQVPRWCAAHGRVLVIEPRRVACRGLASHVAQLEGTRLGRAVGYAVRDDSCFSTDSRIVFATPGIVLRWLADGDLARFGTVVLDEYHERNLDVDLLLALLVEQAPARLVVMSATLDGDRVAAHIQGDHLRAEGRLYPVRVRHLAGNAFLPDVRGLEERIVAAVKQARHDPGDVLVFLPGKGEIARAQEALGRFCEVDVLPIHGGLSLSEQTRVFQTGTRRRVILATNVAETSITIPGVGVVIDSGLVRRTRYHNGRGFLTLAPIAMDSAEQRAGRAGRLAPGVCVRLWSHEALLTERTPPEIHRESLVPLVIAAAACRAQVTTLPFLDAPKPYAIEAAQETLRRLGALDDGGFITQRGRHLFHLPLDAPLAALLVTAQAHDCLDDMIDLVAALAVGRPLFDRGRPQDPEHDLRAAGCDATAAIRAVREGQPGPHNLRAHVLQEARRNRRRLRQLFGCTGPAPATTPVDRRRLIRAALDADAACAYVARRRKRAVAWGNGGTEVTLGKESAVDPDKHEALLVLESQALGIGARKKNVVITCAMPVPVAWLVAAGLGEDEVTGATLKKGRAEARIERIYAGKSLTSREEVPTGPLARATVHRLIIEGRLLPDAWHQSTERLNAVRLFHRLAGAGLVDKARLAMATVPLPEGVPSPATWLTRRLEDLGLESGRDVALLEPEDILAPDLDSLTREWFDRRFPRTLDLGDATYRVAYDLSTRQVVLDKQDGQRKEPPIRRLLPSWPGFSILVRHHSKAWQL